MPKQYKKVMKFTQEIFLQQAEVKFGNKYKYEFPDNFNYNTKVTVTCPVHGTFQQTIASHLGKASAGCPKCGRENTTEKKRGTTEKFVKQSQVVHGNIYDYSITHYTESRGFVKILCRKCGEFEINPCNHLKGMGCVACTRERKCLGLQKTFIENANKIHGNRYSYEHVKYVKNNKKVTITCPVHGNFPQTPNSHLNGNGCLKCGKQRLANLLRSNTEEFVQESKKIHDDNYSYEFVNYVSSVDKVIIVCSTHGQFKMSPSAHLQGQGCKKCGDQRTADAKRKTVEDFIRESNEIHDRRYSYNLVDYKRCHDKVVIVCAKHGEFKMTPKDHLRGHGCKACGSGISPASQRWLDSLGVNEREYRIPNTKYIVDGYDPLTNTVYEFMGVYWHGHPDYFYSEDINPSAKRTYGDLYKETLKKIKDIEDLGYKVMVKWEDPQNRKKIDS